MLLAELFIVKFEVLYENMAIFVENTHAFNDDGFLIVFFMIVMRTFLNLYIKLTRVIEFN